VTHPPPGPPEEDNLGFPLFDVWKEYQEIAKHFNDLLMRLRSQSLGAVAAFAAVAGFVAKGEVAEQLRWGTMAGVFSLLIVFWVAIWVLDFTYYNRLLIGAVDALMAIEDASSRSSRVQRLDLSTRVERIVAERRAPERGKLGRETARWAFYGIVMAGLCAGLLFSIWAAGGLRNVLPPFGG